MMAAMMYQPSRDTAASLIGTVRRGRDETDRQETGHRAPHVSGGDEIQWAAPPYASAGKEKAAPREAVGVCLWSDPPRIVAGPSPGKAGAAGPLPGAQAGTEASGRPALSTPSAARSRAGPAAPAVVRP